MFKNYFDRLFQLVVLEVEDYLEWGDPYLGQPKPKSNRVRFLSDFINLNSKLNRKPYPMPNINEMLL